MSRTHIIRKTKVIRTPRVLQVEGIFELPISERSTESWDVQLTLPAEWNVGVIVGPSGSGKTTIATELFGDYLIDSWQWSEDNSILDDFPEVMSIKEITALLSSVGFSSPPSWLRPFRVLSNGEQFRVHLARTLAQSPDLCVLDEFTSVVDRTVAQIGSAAFQKTVRKREQRCIVVTCHYDVIDWLEPDWVYQPHTNSIQVGRSLWRRPSLQLDVKRVHHRAWELFGKYHYLDSKINSSAYCFCAFIHEQPVAFCAVLHFPHPKSPGWRFHRLVCLPDFQGIGIGSRLADYVGSIFKATGKPVRRTLSHPAVIHAANKSVCWRMTQAPKRNSRGTKTSHQGLRKTYATKRLVASFEYVGEALADTGDIFPHRKQ